MQKYIILSNQCGLFGSSQLFKNPKCCSSSRKFWQIVDNAQIEIVHQHGKSFHK